MFSCLSAYAQQDSAIVAKGERLLNLGYGVTVKAKESSAAISEVTGDEIMKSAATNPLNALYGKGLGLTVLQKGGTVWESVPTTMIRGLNSTRDNSILVIIDGFERDLSMITKEEIESKIEPMAVDAMKSGNIAVNPRASRQCDIEMLYRKAL